MWLMHKHSVHDTHVIFLCVTLYRNMTWLWDLWVVMSRSSTWHDLLIHAQTWNDMNHGSSATLYPWVMSYLFIFIHIYSYLFIFIHIYSYLFISHNSCIECHTRSMSHVMFVHVSTSHVTITCNIYSSVTSTYESCHIYLCVMSHWSVRHVTSTYESRHIHPWVMSHWSLSHVSHIFYESRLIIVCVTSNLPMRHVTFIYESCHAQGTAPRSGVGGMISEWRLPNVWL